MIKRIFLVGYMGSGKTTIGKLLAERLGYRFVDMDTHIEGCLCKSVSQIFAEIGEVEFRLLEKKCLHEVAQFNRTIISTGGGTPCTYDNMDYMNAHGLTIYLKFTVAELAARLEFSQANKRPLLAGRKGKELLCYISDGLLLREPFYAQAALSVTGTEEAVVSQICKYISCL